MNPKTNIKLILDIVLTVLFLMLIDPKNTGYSFHEIAGLSIALLFSIHVLLNWKWIKNTTKNLFKARLKGRSKLYYILDMVSLISIAIIIFTGIEISRVVFASNSVAINHSYVTVHKWVSYFCLGLFGIHAALHWRFIVNASGKLLGSLKAGLLKPVMTMAAAGLVIGLIYAGIASPDDLKTARAEALREVPGRPADMYQNSGKRDQYGSAYSIPPESTAASNQNQDTSVGSSTSTSSDTITLSEFLGKMFCNACDKHCSLLNPQCSRGFQQAEAAKIQYEQKYGEVAAKIS